MPFRKTNYLLIKLFTCKYDRVKTHGRSLLNSEIKACKQKTIDAINRIPVSFTLMINPLAIFVSSLSLDWKQYVAEYVFEDMSAVLSDTYDDDM